MDFYGFWEVTQPVLRSIPKIVEKALIFSPVNYEIYGEKFQTEINDRFIELQTAIDKFLESFHS